MKRKYQLHRSHARNGECLTHPNVAVPTREQGIADTQPEWISNKRCGKRERLAHQTTDPSRLLRKKVSWRGGRR